MRHINSVVRHVVKAVHDRRSVLVTSAYDVVDLIGDCTSPEVSRIKLLLPGSFNPVHHGHVAVLQKAAEVQQLPASSMNDGTSVFEISMTNADKGAIDGEELATRLQGFADIGASVVVTADHPTFVSKAQLLPGRSFGMGYDTALRIVNPKYYLNAQVESMISALRGVYNSGGRFLVGGRLCGSEYLCLSQHPLPKFDGLPEDMFVPIPDFRVDVSSTQLRRGVGYTRTSTHNRQSS